ncbi:hypothetical protein F5Y19DRAFT_469935 [Xylariaceae sp. FL1651]|nr:hypothetical protein F5Y19DRAFT_469935 [Xylariaceae sp. FL1651]
MSRQSEGLESPHNHTAMSSSTNGAYHENSIHETRSQQTQHQEIASSGQRKLSWSRQDRQELQGTHLRSFTQSSYPEGISSGPLQPLLLQEIFSNDVSSAVRESNLEPGCTETRSFVGWSSEPEIAKPTPIAPPNHECTWKDRYLALTAEIRLLKAEMSTRASLRSSDVYATKQEQQDGDFGLQGVTIILHFGDKDDIVINTDLIQGIEPTD